MYNYMHFISYLFQEAKDDGGCIICPLCDKRIHTQHQLTMHIRQVTLPVDFLKSVYKLAKMPESSQPVQAFSEAS